MAKLVPGEVTFYNLDGDIIEKEITEITFSAESAEKDGYKHFMMKEIHEQPDVIRATMNFAIKNGKIDFSSVGLSDEELRSISNITIVTCGSV